MKSILLCAAFFLFLSNFSLAEDAGPTGFQAILKKRKEEADKVQAQEDVQKEVVVEKEEKTPEPTHAKAKKEKKKKPAEPKVASEKKDAEAASTAEKPKVEAAAEEPQLKTKVSGFAAVEHEISRRYGYNVNSATPNFDSHYPNSTEENINVLSNIQFEMSKDKTNLVSVVQMGEIYYGDSASGGVGGAKQKVFLLRNLYITQNFNDSLGADAGIYPLVADPRSFVVADNYSVLKLTYKNSFLSATAWYTPSAKDIPSVTSTVPDKLFGAYASFELPKKNKVTLYGIGRHNQETLIDRDEVTSVVGRNHYTWAGTTMEYKGIDPLAIEATGIENWSKFKPIEGSTAGDSVRSNLLDAKITYSFASPQIDLSIEGLRTSGSDTGYKADTGQRVVGKRHNFNSPIAACYLMTIGCSDGVDDAPGSPKESIVGNLNLNEGVQYLIYKAAWSPIKSLTLMGRFGKIKSTHPNFTTKGNGIGDEYDLNIAYELSAGAVLSFDAARLKPGNYYDPNTRDMAQLYATKLKYSF